MNPYHSIFVPYTNGPPWIVRRDHVELGRYHDQAQALDAARQFAQQLGRRTGQPIDVRMQDEQGRWRTIETAVQTSVDMPPAQAAENPSGRASAHHDHHPQPEPH